ncbi:MAG: hypothetical protein ACJARL_001375 [Halopseudomonas sp.]|jgi:hypothetical protein
MYPMYLRYGDFVAEIKTKARIYHRRALPKNPAVVRVATLPEVPISYLRIRVGPLAYRLRQSCEDGPFSRQVVYQCFFYD